MSKRDVNSNITWISKGELYEILRQIVWFESTKIDINWKTSIFHWIDCSMLLKKLLNHKIWIIEFEKWETIIREWRWDWDCNYFFLLLKWELEILKWDVPITTIKTISVVWEIWFLTKSERTATVKAWTKAYLLPLDQYFIDSLPLEAQVKLYRNLAIETWRKLDYMNQNSCIRKCLMPWWEASWVWVDWVVSNSAEEIRKIIL